MFVELQTNTAFINVPLLLELLRITLPTFFSLDSHRRHFRFKVAGIVCYKTVNSIQLIISGLSYRNEGAKTQ